MIGWLVLLLLAAYPALVVFDLVFQPTRRRLALRNISRRRGEALLVVMGAMLGTAIITSSYVVGDSVSASIVDVARTNLGPLDEAVRVEDIAQLGEISRLVRDPAIGDTDGTLDAKVAIAAVATTGPDRKAVDSVSLVETDFDQARAFGADESATGMGPAGKTPAGDELVVNERTARQLGAKAGDRVEVFAYGATTPFTIRNVIPEIGLAGAALGRASAPAFVAPGTIERIAANRTPSPTDKFNTLAQPPNGVVLVSNTGGVLAGADGSNGVEGAIKARLGDRKGVDVSKTKQGLLDNARRQGDSLTQLFGGIGYFSVAAGLLLLVNLFVMLSEERKTELGMLRALGFKRSHIMRTFSVEGGIYALVAAVVGGFVGIGVGAGITRIANAIFSSDIDDAQQVLSVKPSSVGLGMLIGFFISMATVFVTSLLISRFNIILAIRDLPRPKSRRRRAWIISGSLVVALGTVLTLGGFAGKNGLSVIMGPALVAFGAILVADRKPATIGASSFVVVWAIVVYNLFPDVIGRPSINTFVVEGLTLVAAGVILVMQFDRLWTGLADLLAASGRGLAARLSMAYPLARRMRTGLLLGMFTLVIFTMTFLSAFAEIFASQAPQFTREISAGFEIMMDANPTNPVSPEDVRKVEGVADVVPVTRGDGATYTTKFRSDRPNVTTGITEDFLAHGAPFLSRRLPQFSDDQAAYRAVVHDPNLVIVPATFLIGGGGPPTNPLVPGDKVTVTNKSTGETHELTIAGVFDREFLGNGAVVGSEFATKLLAPRIVQNRYFVKVAPGADAEQVATTLQGKFVPNGLHAETFVHRISVALSQNHSFFTLLRGYLGLGLLIGVAGLGVVMVRAVRERRRQIGMLRAMGFPAKVVRRSFLLESSFLALQGIALGILLGSLTSYQLLAQSDAFGDSRLPYQVPVLALIVIFVLPFVASLLATAAPATKAARIKPAVALRIAD